MLLRLIYALPFTLLFTTMSGEWGVDGFITGYIASLAILFLIGDLPGRLLWARLPLQLFWMVVYVVRLAWEILLSSFDVARRVLDPRLPINPGEISVPIHDDADRDIVAALSAHAVTVTPGEMVIDFEKRESRAYMIVHTLDVDSSRERANQDQEQRSNLLKRIMGEKV